jgi:branched-chain amino acid aminotransferase
VPFAWFNGQWVEEASAAIPLRDAGLLHGAGVFTTLCAVDGRLFRPGNHLQRLRDSCAVLQMPLRFSDVQLVDAVRELLVRNGLSDARLRLTVTRGSTSGDPRHDVRAETNVFLLAEPLVPYPAELYEKGMIVLLNGQQKLNPYDITAGHKTLNYFSRLHALHEAKRQGAGESLWCDVHGFLQSGSISNLFLVKDDQLFTPPTNGEIEHQLSPDAVPYPRSCVLPGITRAVVFDLARQAGLDVHLAAIDARTLFDADEMFMTNSIMRIMPVCRVGRRTIGMDRPGPLTLRLRELLTRATQREA